MGYRWEFYGGVSEVLDVPGIGTRNVMVVHAKGKEINIPKQFHKDSFKCLKHLLFTS